LHSLDFTVNHFYKIIQKVDSARLSKPVNIITGPPNIYSSLFHQMVASNVKKEGKKLN